MVKATLRVVVAMLLFSGAVFAAEKKEYSAAVRAPLNLAPAIFDFIKEELSDMDRVFFRGPRIAMIESMKNHLVLIQNNLNELGGSSIPAWDLAVAGTAVKSMIRQLKALPDELIHHFAYCVTMLQQGVSLDELLELYREEDTRTLMVKLRDDHGKTLQMYYDEAQASMRESASSALAMSAPNPLDSQ